MKKGLVYIFTGEGKGKTSAALGVGVRAALSGMRVAMVCWYKEESWDISEYKISERHKNFKIYPMGKGFYIQDTRMKKAPLASGGIVVDKASSKDHKAAAEAALVKARGLLRKVDVLILDEVNNAVKDRLVKVDDLIELILKRGRAHLVLTGRGADKRIIKVADLVTEMKKVSHPHDKGKKAIKGLDF